MKTITDLIDKIDFCETPQEAAEISTQLFEISEVLSKFRNMPMPDGLESDLEHWEGTADDGVQKAEKMINYLERCDEEERIYGTYEQQVRSTYMGSR